MKAVETKVSILYFNIKYNGGKGSKTKSITATRDHSIAKLKIQLQSSAISIQYYMIQTAKLYSYCNDKEKDLPVSDSLFVVDNVVNTITPVVSVSSLLINVFDEKKISFIRNFCSINRADLLNLLSFFCNANLYTYSFNEEAYFHSTHYLHVKKLVKSYTFSSGVVIKTTGDGRCLFHSISLCLFGNENYSHLLKIANVFFCSKTSLIFLKFSINKNDLFLSIT